jgi:folate-binding protein YgfZ
MGIATFRRAAARRPRAYVRVAGPAAEDYLHRMLSNDVASLDPGGSCEALLLTAKGRIIAPLRVLRRSGDDFLLVTEPELGEVVREALLRARFAARAEIELERHESWVVFGLEADPGEGLSFANDDYGVPAVEVVDGTPPGDAAELDEETLERMRIQAGTPRFGHEIDERVLPAEAGLVERAVSFTKGCFPGQEPVARLHYRGHANRSLRVLAVEGDEVPPRDAEIHHAGKPVGRVTSAARGDDGVVALAYLRVEVPADAELAIGPARARSLH